jgi:hypothetical protein
LQSKQLLSIILFCDSPASPTEAGFAYSYNYVYFLSVKAIIYLASDEVKERLFLIGDGLQAPGRWLDVRLFTIWHCSIIFWFRQRS